ncbi:unnamed protein product [Discula destructiva]
MAISKKLKIQREHKKAEAAGTRAPIKANGLPVKAPKEMVTCQFCKKELVKAFTAQLEAHAETHKGWDKQKCWPTVFTA